MCSENALSSRWVVVYGLAGFGKTVLAAESVRDAAMLREVFPGKCSSHVLPHWVSLLTCVRNIIIQMCCAICTHTLTD